MQLTLAVENMTTVTISSDREEPKIISSTRMELQGTSLLMKFKINGLDLETFHAMRIVNQIR